MSKYKIEVLHIIVGLDIGGAEFAMKRLIENHRESDCFEHKIVSLTNIGTIGDQLRDINIEVYALGMKSLFFAPFVFIKLVLLIRRLRPDIVHTWMYHADLLGGVAARISGNPNVIWCIRSTEVNANGSRFIHAALKLLALFSYYIPKAIVCAAEASKHAHVAIGYSSARMIVVPNGFAAQNLNSATIQGNNLLKQCGWDTEHLVIGCVGRFHSDKDHFNFIQAATLVARQHQNARFLLVGRDLVSNNALLSEWLSGTGFADRFVLLGERSDVPACLAAMDIFCLPSRTEGFPNVVGEAMVMAVPCVVTDVGDAAMLVGETGIVVPKEDANALANGMRQLLEMSPDARKRLGQKARARIEAEFTMDRTRERFEAVYQQVMNMPRP